jgi:sugar phosphate isomerase/epimerase
VADFSYQLYSSRNFPPVSKTLSMLADLGYSQAEGNDAIYADAGKVAALKDDLAATGLTMPSGHFGISMIEAEPDRVIETAHALGIESVYAPYLQEKDRPTTGSGWEAFGRRLAEAGKPIRDAGLNFGWHNHDFELRPLADGTVPLNAIFEGGPDLEWQADIAWIVRGGADPFEWIRTFGDRLTSVHVKDIAANRQTEEDGWADVGTGIVPWAELMPELRRLDVRTFVLEHDNPSDDRRFAANSLAAVKTF